MLILNFYSTNRRFITQLVLGVIFSYYSIEAQEAGTYQLRTIAFYNVENLFDTLNNPVTYDDDWTPKGKLKWSALTYHKKLNNLSRVISGIGGGIRDEAPDIIGLAEIENYEVLKDLVRNEILMPYDYGIIHFDSPDRRGIDVALIYKKEVFTPIEFSKHTLIIRSEKGQREYTRDQLLVFGMLDDEEFYFIVNHWPSRRGGTLKSSYKRREAALLNKKLIDSIKRINPDANIISMGDFNDNPTDSSLKHILNTKGIKDTLAKPELYNPMEALYEKGIGTLAYRDVWSLFDQFFFTGNLLKKESSLYRFWHAGIHVQPYMITDQGLYKGYPKRGYKNGNFTNGYSDHFPIYLFLVRE